MDKNFPELKKDAQTFQKVQGNMKIKGNEHFV